MASCSRSRVVVPRSGDQLDGHRAELEEIRNRTAPGPAWRRRPGPGPRPRPTAEGRIRPSIFVSRRRSARMWPKKSITAEPMRDRPSAPIVPRLRSRAVSGGNRNNALTAAPIRYDQSGIANPALSLLMVLSPECPRATTLLSGGPVVGATDLPGDEGPVRCHRRHVPFQSAPPPRLKPACVRRPETGHPGPGTRDAMIHQPSHSCWLNTPAGHRELGRIGSSWMT